MDATRIQSEGEYITQQDLLCDIVAFTSTSLAFTMTLLNRILCESTSPHMTRPTLLDVEEQNNLAERISRKRKRDSYGSMEIPTHFQNLLKRFMIFHREIHSPWYTKPRSASWYRLYIDWVPGDDPQRFKDFFRLSVPLFQYLCEVVHDEMVTKPPRQFLMLPNRKLWVQRKVAIAIRQLNIGDQVLGIGELFGVSASIVVKCTWKFINAVNKKLRQEIRWPIGDALEAVKEGFQAKGFPSCCGTIDGTHFPVELPRGECSTNYYDYKHNVSVSLQAIVDVKCRFLDVCSGWHGSIQDSRLMRNSGFYRDVVYMKQKLMGLVFICQDGQELREYLLANAGYPLYDWLIVPFARGIDQQHDIYNHKHSSARMVVERSFGRLKGIWRILSRILWEPRVHTIGPMIFCCCILQNLMIRFGEEPAIDEVLANPHPTGDGPILVPIREFYEGGPKARDTLMAKVVGTSARPKPTRPVNTNLRR